MDQATDKGSAGARLRKPLLFLAGVIPGFCVGIALSFGHWSHADPVDLTRAQQARIAHVAQEALRRCPHFKPDGQGNCYECAVEAREALIGSGVPASALRLYRVSYHGALHMLLKIDARVDGKPWQVSFDMLDPWPQTERDRQRIGYVAVN